MTFAGPAPRRGPVLSAVLGAVAVVVLALPLRALFVDDRWVRPAVLALAALVLTGIVLRRVTAHPGPVVLGQVAAASIAVLLTQLQETTIGGVLPTGETLSRLEQLLAEARETIATSPPPAPTTDGVVLVLVGLVLLVGLVVDLAVATAERPALAGPPLLALLLVSAVNIERLSPGWFVAGAGTWVLLLLDRARRELDRWPRAEGGRRPGGQERATALQGAAVGVLAVLLASLSAVAAPQRETNDWIQGLRGGGPDDAEEIRLEDELDLQQSLTSPSDDPVLRYRTDDPTPEPWRVAVVTSVERGRVQVTRERPEPVSGAGLPEPWLGLTTDLKTTVRQVTVLENKVAAPQLPTIARTTALDLGSTPFAMDEAWIASVTERPADYTIETIEPADALDNAPTSDVRLADADPATYTAEELRLAGPAEEAVRDLARSIVEEHGSRTPMETARAIQDHLRGPDYAYSLELEAAASPDEDAVLRFLRTKVGYCQQFSTTMALLARAQGIPARVVVGYTPGSSDGTLRTVRRSDAHAWPELYLGGLGWTRFEPTPGSDAAPTPGYSLLDAGDTEDAAQPESSSSSAPADTPTSEPARPQPEQDSAPVADGDEGSEGGDHAERPWWRGPALTLLLLAAALGVLPATAWWTRRRWRHGTDTGDRVEHEWARLLSRLGDLGVHPPRGSTPRQTSGWVSAHLGLTEDQRRQLEAVVDVVERSRYGQPGAELADVGPAADAVVAHARSLRPARQRWRATLLPSDGARVWRSLGARRGTRQSR